VGVFHDPLTRLLSVAVSEIRLGYMLFLTDDFIKDWKTREPMIAEIVSNRNISGKYYEMELVLNHG
jgi:hypothetical protein